MKIDNYWFYVVLRHYQVQDSEGVLLSGATTAREP